MNVLKNVLGVLGYFLINIAPWFFFLVGLFSKDIFILIGSSFIILYQKLKHIETLLLSISNAFVALLAVKKEVEEEDNNNNNELNKDMFR